MKKTILTFFFVLSMFFICGCQLPQGPTTTTKYKLSFYNGEELIQTKELASGDAIKLIEAPIVEGYEFVEWLDAEGEKFELEVMPNNDVKVYASYKETVKLYTYRFLDYDGTVLYERKVAEGTPILIPSTPKREKEGTISYTFDGWDKTIPSSMPAEDIDFTATYTSKEVVVVKYEIDGGNWSYYGYDDVVKDLLKDYNSFAGKSYTASNLPTGAWECTNFHSFYFSGNNSVKWKWLLDYLTSTCSAQNYKALNSMKKCSSAKELNEMGSDYAYSVSYEFRAFIIGGIIDANASYPSSDYSTFEMQNNFWEYYNNSIKNTLEVEYEPNKVITLKNAYKADHEFAGWYDNPEFSGNPLKSIKLTEDVTLYAKFDIPNPVTEIQVTNKVSELARYETLQLEWLVLPTDAGNKKLKFSSSNTDVITISQSGLITAIANGTAKITISSYLTPSTVTEWEIEVYTPNRIELELAASTAKVGEELKIEPSFVGRDGSNEGTFGYASSNEQIATVDASGVVKGIKAGSVEITVTELNTNTKTIVGLTFVEDEVSDILELILNSHETEVFKRQNLGIGSGSPAYYADIVGSVSKLLMNYDYEVDKTYKDTEVNNKTGDYYSSMTSIEFITVHYTGNMSAGADALANAKYFVGANDVSIHYTTGNDGIYQCLDHAQGGYHAGDSGAYAQVGAFQWIPTGVKVGANDPMYPEFTISTDFYYEINGQKTSVPMPKPWNYNGRNTDHVLNADGTISSQKGFSQPFNGRSPESFINNQSLPFKIVNGEYYMGTTWWAYTQVYEGRICSTGGNRNSVGIESCVNKGSDLWYTWQITAQLVARLMQETNLDITRVRGHHFYTAKDCPQPMLENDLEIWWEFLALVEAEYELLTKFSDYNISFESHNPSIVNSRGRVIAKPLHTTSVGYTITIEKDGVSESITLYTLVEGTYNE